MTCVETGSGRQAQPCRDMLLDARVDVGEGADRAGDGAGRDLRARRDQPLAGAGELGVGLRQLEAEGGRLGVDAVAAADGGRVLVLEGAPLQRREQRVEIGEQDVGGAHQLHGEAGVEHVRRGHALVHEARVRPDDLGEMGQEGDDVVLGLALDLVDARDVEVRGAALFPDRLGGFLRDDAELGHARRRHAPRSRTRCGTGFPATRWRPFRAGNSAGSSCGRGLRVGTSTMRAFGKPSRSRRHATFSGRSHASRQFRSPRLAC